MVLRVRWGGGDGMSVRIGRDVRQGRRAAIRIVDIVVLLCVWY